MRKISLILLGLVLGLSSCTPGLFGSESWGKSIFSPSATSDRAACDAGYQYSQTARALNNVGIISFSAPQGRVALYTRLGKLYFLCNSIGLITNRKDDDLSSIFTTDILFDDPALVGKVALVSVSLEDAKGQEIARLKAEQKATENARQWYAPRSYSGADIAALDKAVTFTIIIDRGSGEEKYKVTQQFQPYGPSIGARVKAFDVLSRHTLKAMGLEP